MTRAVHKPIVNDEGDITMKSEIQTPKDDPGLDPLSPILIEDVDVEESEGEESIVYTYSNAASHPLSEYLNCQAGMMASVNKKCSPITEIDPFVLEQLTWDMMHKSDTLISEVMECEVLDVFYRVFSAYLSYLDYYLKPATPEASCGNLIKILYGFTPLRRIRNDIGFIRSQKNMTPEQKSIYFFNQTGIAFEADAYNCLWKLVYDHVYTNLLLGNYNTDDDTPDDIVNVVVNAFNSTFIQIREMIRPSFAAFGYRSMVMDINVANGVAEQQVANKKQKYFSKKIK